MDVCFGCVCGGRGEEGKRGGVCGVVK